MKAPRDVKTFVVIVVIVVLLLVARVLEKGNEDIEEKQYCMMVYDFERSGGQVGWPDFKDVYDAQCVDGKLREEK